ncbi:MAG: 2-oxo acid dehydrogenase subunit E2 [Chloroflexota bacterium]|jgi:pyruvate dehydrogenase E2 component (dihydrolipoamide acetyltransferase)
MAEFKMPSLGADMDAGILYEWFIKPGGTIKRGDVIASIETDKGVIDVECFEEGVVVELSVESGTKVPVGQTIAVLQLAGEPVAATVSTATEPPAPVEQVPPPSVKSPAAEVSVSRLSGRVKASPAARKLAAELGIDLAQVIGTGSDGSIHLDDIQLAAAAVAEVAQPAVTPEAEIRATPVARRMAEDLGVDLHGVQGTGPHGTISRTDVENLAAEQAKAATLPPAPPPEPVAEPSAKPAQPPDFQTAMRRAIALAMARSNREIPHYYLETRIDMTRALAWLETENVKRSVAERILPVVLLIKATAKGLIEVPDLNGYWREDRFEASESIHIGFAISLRQGGLVTPAIHDADDKSLDELMVAMRDLITRTRGGRLRSSELMDATITLTSLGDTGVDKVYGVIYPPQVALVGFGKVMDQPWAEKGMLGIRPILTATLAGDHRASDGRRGAQFLSALEKLLQEPEKL